MSRRNILAEIPLNIQETTFQSVVDAHAQTVSFNDPATKDAPPKIEKSSLDLADDPSVLLNQLEAAAQVDTAVKEVLTELAVEATSLSADTPEAEAVMIRAGADDVKDVSGNTEVAAQVVLVRKDILEPAESWIRSWVPLREGRTVVFTA